MRWDEVAKALKECLGDGFECHVCPLYTDDNCRDRLWEAAKDYIVPRVMTVEEVKELGEWNSERVCWYEERGKATKICSPRYYNYASLDDEPSKFDEFVSIGVLWTDYYDNECMQDYGKTWRLWTLEPTEEERKAAEWDNGED